VFLISISLSPKGRDSHRLLTKYRKELEALAGALLERETLDEGEILEVTGLPPAPPLENRQVPVPDADSRM
jgi:cell division protease FtsH